MDTIQTNNEVEFSSINANPQDLVRAAEADMNFLAALCFPEVMKFMFPPMFIAMWELLRSRVHLFRDFSKIALGIPRGFAKTTFVKLFVIFCILFTKKSFIAIVSYAEDHAISIITDVCTMLSHPNIKAIFGDWTANQEIDQAATQIFSFRGRKIILKAVGAKGGIRGINYLNLRPDVIILEDYQKKAEAENEEVSKKLYEEMIGTVMKAKSPFGCLYLFVGNMYATQGSILKKLKDNPDWESLIVGGILEDGSSLWEDLQPIEQLLKEYESDSRAGVPQVFLAEVLNDENAGIKAGIDLSQIPYFPYTEEESPQGRAIVIDPALDNPNSDYNGLGCVGLFDGVPTLEEVELERFTPLGLIKAALRMGYKKSCRLITVENSAYQASLLFWFNEVCKANGIEGFTFMPLDIGQKAKNAKIKSALEQLIKREVYIKNPVRGLLINEIVKWIPTKKNNSDTVLDLLWMSVYVKKQYEGMMYMPYEVESLVAQNAVVLSVEQNCSF